MKEKELYDILKENLSEFFEYDNNIIYEFIKILKINKKITPKLISEKLKIKEIKAFFFLLECVKHNILKLSFSVHCKNCSKKIATFYNVYIEKIEGMKIQCPHCETKIIVKKENVTFCFENNI